MEEGSREQDVGVHPGPADAAREGERHLRGLEGVLCEAADVGVVPDLRRRGFQERRGAVHDPRDEGVYPGVGDLCGHTGQPPPNILVIDGRVDEVRRIERIGRHRGQKVGDPVVHVDLAGAVVNPRVAQDTVDLPYLDRAVEFLDLPRTIGRTPDLAGPPARPVGDGELDVLASIPLLFEACSLHHEGCIDLHAPADLLKKDRLLDHRAHPRIIQESYARGGLKTQRFVSGGRVPGEASTRPPTTAIPSPVGP